MAGTTMFAVAANATTVTVPVTADCSLYANASSTSSCTASPRASARPRPKMVAAWAAGRAPNHGLALVSPWPGVLAATYAASEDGPSTAPFIEITYKPNTGVNPAFAGHSIPLADGSALNVNLGTGNLTLTTQDL